MHNAGGVAVSGLEIEQNKLGKKWSFEEVDSKLKQIMKVIFRNCYDTAKRLGFTSPWKYSSRLN